MLKLIVLWVVLQGQPTMVANVAVKADTGIMYLNSQLAIETCEAQAHYFRSLGLVAWCAPHLDF